MNNLKRYNELYEAEIKPGKTIIIKTKDKKTAKDIAKMINDKGQKVGASSWVIDDTTVGADIPWSPGLRRSLTQDLERFAGYVSWDYSEKQEDPNEKAWKEVYDQFMKDAKSKDLATNSTTDFLRYLTDNYKAPDNK